MMIHPEVRSGVGAQGALGTLGALLAATLVAAGCARSHDAEPTRYDSSAATSASPSANASAGTTTGAMAAPPGSTAVSQGAAGDSTHLTDANILAVEKGGDSSEVVIATFVRARTTSAPIRSYATMLVDDHGKGQRETESLARSLGVTPQSPPGDTTAQKTLHTLERLRTLKGAALDTAFVNGEILDHKHDIEEAHRMAADAHQPRVRTLVQSSLPVLQKHLDRAQQLVK